ncbi:MAG: hypothetical protein ACYTGG_11555 [Planctomycetota bacterium]|jgi:hypothetical protein
MRAHSAFASGPFTILLAVLASTVAATPATGQCLEGCTVIHELFGEATGDQFGYRVIGGADATGDGTVDIADLLALLADWGNAGPCDIAPKPADGVIDVRDLLDLLGSWGPCP